MDIRLMLPLLISIVGAYFLVKLRFFFILHPIRTARRMLGSFGVTGDRGAALSALSLALAGTLGVGNITGVAVGIIIGGAGSVFWLFLSSLFSAVLKYSESVLTIDNLASGGGMMYVIRNSFARHGGWLSGVYAAACILIALGMGAALQSNTIVVTAAEALSAPSPLIAAAVLFLVALGIVGGGDRIEKITVILIPLTTIVYIILTSSVILANISHISEVLLLIVKSAFKPEGALGGAVGVLASRAVSEGYARGILSNEAGAGTSSLAHSRNRAARPTDEGMLGVLEVFFDTALLCTLTALSILLSVECPESYDSGMGLVLAAIESVFSGVGGELLFFCVLAFAYSTVICWYYYGRECSRYLLGQRSSLPYSFLFLASILAGSFLETVVLIRSVDMLLLILSFISLSALLKNSDRIIFLSESEGVITKRESSRESRRRPR